MARIRYGIDARLMGAGYGIGRYITELVRAEIAQLNESETLVLFVRNKNHEFVDEQCVETIKADIPWYSWQEQVFFVPHIKKAKVDLMHYPHWNVPLAAPVPFVLTIHDLTMYHHARPEATTLGPLIYAIKDRVHRVVLTYAAKRAVKIITPSNYVATDIVQTLGIKREKIQTIYEGLSKRNTNGQLPAQLQNKPYVLYVGAAYPHKNLQTLLKAWARFEATWHQEARSKQENDSLTLILAGNPNQFYTQLISSPEWHACQHVQYIGFVPDKDLGALYAHAAAFLFPSLSEGFGLPPLEAMQYATPVVSSSSTCLPEVLGDAALYTDPHSPAAMAEAIHTAVYDTNVRSVLRMRDREHVKQYSWQRAAAQTLAIYRQSLMV